MASVPQYSGAFSGIVGGVVPGFGPQPVVHTAPPGPPTFVAERLARVFGTEEDPVNCSFFFKVGACRNGDNCYKKHNQPSSSETILLSGLYAVPPEGVAISNEQPWDDDMYDVAQKHLEQFYEDVFLTVAEYGEIEEVVILDNTTRNLFGNVYVKFYEERHAAKALKGLTGRFYDGRMICAEFTPVADFREARCRAHHERRCPRVGTCGFMHIKHIPRAVKRRVVRMMYREHPEFLYKRYGGVEERSPSPEEQLPPLSKRPMPTPRARGADPMDQRRYKELQQDKRRIEDMDDDLDDEDLDGEPIDGEPIDGEPIDDEPVDGEALEDREEALEGEALEGEPLEGEPLDDDPSDGEPMDGEPMAPRRRRRRRRGENEERGPECEEDQRIDDANGCPRRRRRRRQSQRDTGDGQGNSEDSLQDVADGYRQQVQDRSCAASPPRRRYTERPTEQIPRGRSVDYDRGRQNGDVGNNPSRRRRKRQDKEDFVDKDYDGSDIDEEPALEQQTRRRRRRRRGEVDDFDEFDAPHGVRSGRGPDRRPIVYDDDDF